MRRNDGKPKRAWRRYEFRRWARFLLARDITLARALTAERPARVWVVYGVRV